MEEQADVWLVFWKRYQERYPVASVFENAIAVRVKQMWTDVSPTYEMPLSAVWTLENGEFKANMLGFLILGAIGEVVFENLTKYLVSPEVLKTIEAKVVESAKEALKKEIMEPGEILISVAECSKCKHPNDPTAKFCNQCGAKLKSS